MPNYQRLATRVLATLEKNGVAVVLTKKVKDEYDARAGTSDDLGAPQTFPGFAVRDGATSVYASQQTREPGSIAKIQNLKCLMGFAAGIPEVNDTFTFDGDPTVWTLDGVTPVAPGPITVVYEVEASA